MKKIKSLLEQRSVYRVLLLANALAIIVGFYLGHLSAFPDQVGYLNMSTSIQYGKFSSWYFLPLDTPETLRLWGYPFFIYLCRLVYDSQLTVKAAQLAIHFGTILLMLRLIRHFHKELVWRNIFLLLLLPNVQIAFYSGQIAAETTNIFFLVCFFYIWFTWRNRWIKYIVLAIIAFFIFQLRPVFLAFPFFMVLNNLLLKRTQVLYQFGFLAMFTLLLLPFGFWNKKHHGIFKITPLEGGSGAAHLGYWSFKLPTGYTNSFYWNPTIQSDITQPSFASEADKQRNLIEYENEWKMINEELKQYFTPEDSIRMALMKGGLIGQFVTYNGKYTNAREILLRQQLVKHIKDHPGYYVKTRLYTLLRIWFTGVNKDELAKATSLTEKIKLVYPFLVTVFFILGGLFFLVFALIKGWLDWEKYFPFLLVIIYYGLFHLPFVIQARYTVPVHLYILLLLTMVIGGRMERKKEPVQSAVS